MIKPPYWIEPVDDTSGILVVDGHFVCSSMCSHPDVNKSDCKPAFPVLIEMADRVSLAANSWYRGQFVYDL